MHPDAWPNDSYHPEVNYFPKSVGPRVSYSCYTAALFDRLQSLVIKEDRSYFFSVFFFFEINLTKMQLVMLQSNHNITEYILNFPIAENFKE